MHTVYNDQITAISILITSNFIISWGNFRSFGLAVLKDNYKSV